jgi:plastocyanin
VTAAGRRRPLAAAARLGVLLMALALLGVSPLVAQRLPERTPNLPNATTPLPGMLEASLSHRFAGADGVRGVASAATFDLALGLPFLLPVRLAAGLRFSPAGADGSDEWEAYDRFGLLRQAAGARVDLNVTGAWNFTARSLDVEANAARRFGGARGIAAVRALSSPYADDVLRLAVAGGVVLHPTPRSSPLAVTADLATLLDRRAGEHVAWSVGALTGLPHTTLSLSLYATNARGPSLQGASVGGGRTRWGVELNAPIEFTGFLLNMYASRDRAQRSVRAAPDAGATHTVRMFAYMYAPATLIIGVGDVVEWVNDDVVVHTVTSENGGFDSRGVQGGSVWRARFTEPGIYPYYCAPHPFMKGVVVVR